MKEYRINSGTLAILPHGKKQSIIYEDKTSFIIDRRPNHIININCMFHGSSLDGRLRGTEQLTGYCYKAPILVRDDGNLIFFPTSSPRLKSCAWINLANVKGYFYNDEKQVSTIRFYNNILIEIPTSISIINNQVLRATRLDSIIRKIRLQNT